MCKITEKKLHKVQNRKILLIRIFLPSPLSFCFSFFFVHYKGKRLHQILQETRFRWLDEFHRQFTVKKENKWIMFGAPLLKTKIYWRSKRMQFSECWSLTWFWLNLRTECLLIEVTAFQRRLSGAEPASAPLNSPQGFCGQCRDGS